ncbi:unnamed protein product, partial [Choristocarpus tenellus]
LRILTRKYQFHFVGDSTTRRLAASFEAIYTGKPPVHTLSHQRVPHYVEQLTATFKWKPLCPNISAEIVDVLEALQTRVNTKQLVFITSYGVHEITDVSDYQRSTPLPAFSPTCNSGIRNERAMSEAALERCMNVTKALIHLAQGVDLATPPIVLVMEGNPFRADDIRKDWMQELHQKRLEIFRRAAGSSRDLIVPYMLEDTAGIFDRLECKRKDSIHFYEPVKLIQAQLVWYAMNMI